MLLTFEHKHHCEACGLVWEHDPGTGLGSRINARNYRPPSRGLSHSCPGCGEVVTRLYEGPLEVNVSHYAVWVRPVIGKDYGQALGA